MSEKFLNEERKSYTDLSTVESQRNDLTFEEFPEGPYGSPINSERLGKSSPWRIDQRSASTRFDYENHQLHENLQREYPGQDVFEETETVPDE
ncbi:hypothetical protein [Paenibacillus sp. NPDC058174]|uniref:hypothetical protein n=1 Tax=Paenibacillus sp. NPDC058174 TaxID=3346366 RepID=UPI0036D9D5A5